MRKTILFATLGLCLAWLTATAQQRKIAVYAVGFYNQENLFDTCHDAGKNDYEYLPTGKTQWTGLKYQHKLRNMSRALADMGTDVLPGVGCAAIGVSEVENARALADLVAQEPLRARGYQFAHIEGPDKRGVDCALLYNPALFHVNKVSLPLYRYELEEDIRKDRQTRGFLTVEGEMAGEALTIIVCHLPSRFAGSYYRELGGRQVRAVKDSLLRAHPEMKVLIMGDMNDDPSDKSMTTALGAKGDKAQVGEGEMYNPWYNIHKKGTGTLQYKGAWNLFDQIVMTPNLLQRGEKRDYTRLRFWRPQIFRRDYLFQTEGKYKGAPLRTHAGGVWLDGYSDHLPVVTYFTKEAR